MAYHEAGHAVVGWIRGFRIKEVCAGHVEFHDSEVTHILERLHECGRLALSEDYKREVEKLIRGYCEMLQAGYTAMNLLRPDLPLMECVRLSGAQDNATQQQLGALVEEDPLRRSAWFLGINRSVAGILSESESWRAVEAVARRLQESSSIAGEEVEAIIGGIVSAGKGSNKGGERGDPEKGTT
jgi:hypothetical protein